jgi:hypothetical protein
MIFKEGDLTPALTLELLSRPRHSLCGRKDAVRGNGLAW